MTRTRTRRTTEEKSPGSEHANKVRYEMMQAAGITGKWTTAVIARTELKGRDYNKNR